MHPVCNHISVLDDPLVSSLAELHYAQRSSYHDSLRIDVGDHATLDISAILAEIYLSEYPMDPWR